MKRFSSYIHVTVTTHEKNAREAKRSATQVCVTIASSGIMKNCSIELNIFPSKNFVNGNLKNWRKLIFVLMGVNPQSKKAIPKTQNYKNLVRTVGRCWYLKMYPAIQNPDIPTHSFCHRNFWKLSDVTEKMNCYDKAEIRTRSYCWRNFCPHPTDDIFIITKFINWRKLPKKNDTNHWKNFIFVQKRKWKKNRNFSFLFLILL